MNGEDRKILERIALAQEKIAASITKPAAKGMSTLNTAALLATALGAGLFGAVDFIIRFFGG